ncbi:tail fiber protein [Clostridium sp. VAP41]|uniref:tail fiber protein n=1 Tax=Clostridium sp. VAP41 TaxID=2949979 RepID=UPI00207A1667|nr:tail fiber protein [Clostridium sp. VAP41]
MKLTSNYSLKKPDGSDVVNVQDFNDNSDKIDLELKKVDSSLKDIANKVDNIKIADGTTTAKGIVKLNNATNSTSQTEAATPLAVKTAMDKANEAFQYASNGKNLIAGKVGNVTGNNTHAEIANRIQTDKNTAAANLCNKGVPTSGNEALASLANKINQIQLGYKPGQFINDKNIQLNLEEKWSIPIPSNGHYSIASDQNNNLYVGHSIVKKIDPSGKTVWEYKPDKVPWSIDVDDEGNSYVGCEEGSLRKINSSGKEEWKYVADTNKLGVGVVATDKKGSIYISNRRDYTIKVNSNGQKVWKTIVESNTIVLDKDGNIYFNGHCDDKNYIKKLIKMTPDGYKKWSKDGDDITSIAIDGNGIIYAIDNERDTRYSHPTIVRIDQQGNALGQTKGFMYVDIQVYNNNIYFCSHAFNSLIKADTQFTIIYSKIYSQTIDKVVESKDGNLYVAFTNAIKRIVPSYKIVQ